MVQCILIHSIGFLTMAGLITSTLLIANFHVVVLGQVGTFQGFDDRTVHDWMVGHWDQGLKWLMKTIVLIEQDYSDGFK